MPCLVVRPFILVRWSLTRIMPPRLVPGHVFCHSCITKCLEAVKPRKICQCPLCKKPATQKTILRLFLQPRSPNSSPTKRGHLSEAEKSRARALRQELEGLDNNGSEETISQACADMNRFSESVAGTSMDIETKVSGNGWASLKDLTRPPYSVSPRR